VAKHAVASGADVEIDVVDDAVFLRYVTTPPNPELALPTLRVTVPAAPIARPTRVVTPPRAR